MKKTIVISISLLILLPFIGLTVSAFSADLKIGKNTDVIGSVVAWKSGGDLNIRYVITDPNWCMTKTQLHLASSPDAFPHTKNGNPIPGHFDYKGLFNSDPEGNACGEEYKFIIQLNGYAGKLYIAAHADVLNRVTKELEGAWADGYDFPGANWATYLTYTIWDPNMPR